jgi:hypothetical protein
MELSKRLCVPVLASLAVCALVYTYPINGSPKFGVHTKADAQFKKCCENKKTIPTTLLPLCRHTGPARKTDQLPKPGDQGFDEYMHCLGVGTDIRDCCSK